MCECFWEEDNMTLTMEGHGQSGEECLGAPNPPPYDQSTIFEIFQKLHQVSEGRLIKQHDA